MEIIPTAQKDGYNFNGWYDENGKKATLNTVFDKLTDLKAVGHSRLTLMMQTKFPIGHIR